MNQCITRCADKMSEIRLLNRYIYSKKKNEETVLGESSRRVTRTKKGDIEKSVINYVGEICCAYRRNVSRRCVEKVCSMVNAGMCARIFSPSSRALYSCRVIAIGLDVSG